MHTTIVEVMRCHHWHLLGGWDFNGNWWTISSRIIFENLCIVTIQYCGTRIGGTVKEIDTIISDMFAHLVAWIETLLINAGWGVH